MILANRSGETGGISLSTVLSSRKNRPQHP